MSFSDTTLTMPVAPANANNGGGFGYDGGWLWLIVLFIFAGWGRGGWGNDGGGATPYATSAVTQADLQRGFDTQGILNGIGNIQNGICSLGYDQLAQMNGISTNIMQTGYGIQTQLANMAAENANCCCQTQRAIDGVNYNMATQACDTRNVIQNGTRDIIENQNANSRAILDFLTNEKIDSLRTELTQAQAQLSQANQTNNIIAALRPCPQPAYLTCNPWGGQSYGCCAPCGC